VQDGVITLPDGTIQVPNTGSNQLFRLSIQRMTGGTNSPYETLDSVPQRTLDLARQHFLSNLPAPRMATLHTGGHQQLERNRKDLVARSEVL
jgi:hypothetical protein